jgi:hypothetical protein
MLRIRGANRREAPSATAVASDKAGAEAIG